jgi:hypothetical protein
MNFAWVNASNALMFINLFQPLIIIKINIVNWDEIKLMYEALEWSLKTLLKRDFQWKITEKLQV